MSVDLASTRTAIASLLSGTSGINSVLAYDQSDVGSNRLPCAGVKLVRVTQPGYDGGIGQLGMFVYEAEWHINVRLSTVQGPAPEVVAQQLFESVFEAVRASFDGDQLIDPNGPGVVDVSSITSGDLMIPTDPALPFVAAFVLKTRVIA